MTNPILAIMTYNMTPQAIINEPYTNQEKIEKPGVSDMVIGSIVYLFRDFLKFGPKFSLIFCIEYLNNLVII